MERIAVLDHGFVEFVEHWGSDERIIEAARESTDKGFLGWDSVVIDDCGEEHVEDHARIPVVRQQLDEGLRVRLWDVEKINVGKKHCVVDGSTAVDEYIRRGFTYVDIVNVRTGDERLLAFLDRNRHTSPFEFAGAVIRVQAPIFVFREWHRHRTQSYSEISARYTPLPDFNYIPTVERLLLNSKTNKQAGTAKGAAELTEEKAGWFQERRSAHSTRLLRRSTKKRSLQASRRSSRAFTCLSDATAACVPPPICTTGCTF